MTPTLEIAQQVLASHSFSELLHVEIVAFGPDGVELRIPFTSQLKQQNGFVHGGGVSYPQVSASCWFLDRVVNMMDEGVDVAVRIGELPDSSMQAVSVGRARRVICAAPIYLEKHGIPLTPDALSAHCIVSASPVTPTAEWRLMENGEPRIVKLQARLITTINDSAVAAAVSGFGLTRLLSYQVADQLRDGQLKTILNEYEPVPLPVHLVHREGRHALQQARAFLDLALERLRANPALN